jgi:hypothetical protein
LARWNSGATKSRAATSLWQRRLSIMLTNGLHIVVVLRGKSSDGDDDGRCGLLVALAV